MKWFFLFVLLFRFIQAESQTLLVTGGAGFLGSHFVQHMYETHPDYQIIVLDSLTYSSNIENIPHHIRSSPRFKFVQASICDKQVVDQLLGQSDLVVHFAAETDVTRSIADDEVFYITNVMGTRTLMHYLVKYKEKVKRFVHISSSEVYGTCENEEIDEEHPLNPRSPYAASKAGADRTVYAYGCTYDVPVTILRFFNNYGPGQHVEKMVAKFITLSLNNEPFEIHGTGKQMRDWIHVKDTARAVDAALHIPNFDRIKNQVINCGTGVATSVIEIAEIINGNFGLPKEKIAFAEDRPGQVHKHLSSTAKAKQLLGWEALIPFEKGILQTIQWYKEHPQFWSETICDTQIRKNYCEIVYDKLNK